MFMHRDAYSVSEDHGSYGMLGVPALAYTLQLKRKLGRSATRKESSSSVDGSRSL